MTQSPEPLGTSAASISGEATEQLTALIGDRKLTKQALSEPQVRQAFELVGRAAATGSLSERLHATSILGKASEVSPPAAAVARPLLQRALSTPLPDLGSWDASADDRYYLAKAVGASTADWIGHYAARALIQGDTSERKPRAVWAQEAINRAKSLSDVLRTIGSALSEGASSNEASADNETRRITRVLDAIADPMSVADIQIGDGFGKALVGIVMRASASKSPESKVLREEATASVLGLLVRLLRLRFAIAFDHDLYRAGGIALAWWRPARPPSKAIQQAERIVALAMDALHVLARQGVQNTGLRSALVAAFGTEAVNRIGAQITSGDPSLEPRIAYWLSTGRNDTAARTNPAARTTSDYELDELVGQLLLAVEIQDGGPQALAQVLSQIELLDPSHGETINLSIKRALLIEQWAKAVADKRRITLFGRRGEVVRFDPALHEAHTSLQVGAPARLRVPGVQKEADDRPSVIIAKAILELQ